MISKEQFKTRLKNPLRADIIRLVKSFEGELIRSGALEFNHSYEKHNETPLGPATIHKIQAVCPKTISHAIICNMFDQHFKNDSKKLETECNYDIRMPATNTFFAVIWECDRRKTHND